MTTNGTQSAVRDRARVEAQSVLKRCPGFAQLPRADQLALYRELVEARAAELALRPPGFAGALAAPRKAGDLIDDKRHENRRIEQAGELAGEFMEQVDFPKFVRDLLKGVFDANLEVTVKQMDAYIKLMKAATQSIAQFVKQVDDAAAFGYLAENQGDDFSLDFSDEKDAQGNAKAVLKDRDGNVLDPSDNAIKAKIMDAKIAMAREQRALLRETILMGVTRLVVERGTVKAAVVFDMKASERIDKADKAAMKEAHARSGSTSASMGVLGSIFGGPRAGGTMTDSRTQISVSSAKSTATTDLSAKVTGSVEIVFKADYFKLDNFAEMYGQVKSDLAKPAPASAPGGAPPALPPAPAGAR